MNVGFCVGFVVKGCDVGVFIWWEFGDVGEGVEEDGVNFLGEGGGEDVLDGEEFFVGVGVVWGYGGEGGCGYDEGCVDVFEGGEEGGGGVEVDLGGDLDGVGGVVGGVVVGIGIRGIVDEVVLLFEWDRRSWGNG